MSCNCNNSNSETGKNVIVTKDYPAGVGLTQRKATVQFANSWGLMVSSVTIRHLRSNDLNKSESRTFTDIPDGESSPADDLMNIVYETGAGSDRDCWWIKFVTESGETFQSKDDFRCNLTESDDGKTVIMQINGQSNELKVRPPASSNCSTDSITKQ